jgi:hypothetical protein
VATEPVSSCAPQIKTSATPLVPRNSKSIIGSELFQVSVMLYLTHSDVGVMSTAPRLSLISKNPVVPDTCFMNSDSDSCVPFASQQYFGAKLLGHPFPSIFVAVAVPSGAISVVLITEIQRPCVAKIATNGSFPQASTNRFRLC